MNHRTKIKCSVGILTYNSGKTLSRTLNSISDFSDIIISDGGSTDKTLDIAKEYDCVIIEQNSKLNPSKDKNHPIDDFALERNRMIKLAKNDWFFWLDSDEYISEELHDEVALVCSLKASEYYAYNIPIALQSADGSVTYRSWKQMYQIRFFNLKTEGCFKKKIHEKFIFDGNRYTVGTLKGLWYVPQHRTSFKSYKEIVNYRLYTMHSNSIPPNLFIYFKKGLYLPCKRILGVLYRDLRLRLNYPSNEIVPLSITRNRLYSQWVTFKIVTQLYFTRKK